MLTHLALGYRSLRRTPLLWLGIVATLALALAATVVVFNLVNTYLIRPLPYGDTSRLAVIYEYSLKTGRERRGTSRVSSGTFVDLRERATSFSRLATVFNASVTLHAGATTEVDFVQRVTPDFFPMIGARAALGETIAPANAEFGGQRAVVLSNELWRRRFGADAAIVGKSIQLDEANYTVVGVMPADFKTPTQDNNPQAWLTMIATDYPRNQRTLRRHYVLGELAPGRSFAVASAELDQIATALRREFPGPNTDRGLLPFTMREDLVGNFDRQLLLLQGAVSLVLLVACLNCLCLLLARAIQRQREFAVRLALGASRRALLAQLFAESLWLALPAGVIGDLLAAFAAPLVQGQLPQFNALPGATSDATVHVAVFVVALAIAFLFSLVSLVQTRRLNLEAALRDGGRNLSSAGSARATRWLATGQIAVALALLVGAALLVRSYRELRAIDVGLPIAELDYFRVGLRGDAYQDPLRRQQFFDRVADNLRQIPGVREVGVTPVPFAVANAGFPGFIQEGDSVTPAESPKRAIPRPVSPSFRATTDLKLSSGRWLADTDDEKHPLVTVINASLARRFWPDQGPLGKRVQFDGMTTWAEIVGVVEDTLGLGNQPGVVDTFYFTPQQRAPNFLGNGFLVRFSGPPPNERLLERAVWAVDPNMQFWAHQLVADTYAQSAWQTRFVLTLVATFSALAVALSLAGIYAVLSFLVSRRISEFGVRIALGATATNITELVLRDAVRMTLTGVAAGCLLAWLGSRSLADLLYHVPTVDAVSYALSALAMGVACAIAALLPARRATKVDPIVALRAE